MRILPSVIGGRRTYTTWIGELLMLSFAVKFLHASANLDGFAKEVIELARLGVRDAAEMCQQVLVMCNAANGKP